MYTKKHFGQMVEKLLETCVPGLVGSIPTQSRQNNIINQLYNFSPPQSFASEPSNNYIWRFFV
jgi:hypothetical protein